MTQPRLDHVVIAVSDFERYNRFYAEVLGAEVIELRRGRYAYRFCEQQLNVHEPGSLAQPLAAKPVVPVNSDLCFVWQGAIEETVAHLRARDVEVELRPVQRNGARGGLGASVYFRDPDGSLLELIAYPS